MTLDFLVAQFLLQALYQTLGEGDTFPWFDALVDLEEIVY